MLDVLGKSRPEITFKIPKFCVNFILNICIVFTCSFSLLKQRKCSVFVIKCGLSSQTRVTGVNALRLLKPRGGGLQFVTLSVSSTFYFGGSVQEEVRPGVSEQLEVSPVSAVEAAHIPFPDAPEVSLDFGAVVFGDARRDVRVRDQTVDVRPLENMRRILLQSLVVPDDVVADLARRAQLRERDPVDDVSAELTVQPPAALAVAEVTHKVIKSQPCTALLSIGVMVAVDPPVLPDDGGGNVVFVPWLKARIQHKLVLKGGDESLERITDDQELKVRTQSLSDLWRAVGAQSWQTVLLVVVDDVFRDFLHTRKRSVEDDEDLLPLRVSNFGRLAEEDFVFVAHKDSVQDEFGDGDVSEVLQTGVSADGRQQHVPLVYDALPQQ